MNMSMSPRLGHSVGGTCFSFDLTESFINLAYMENYTRRVIFFEYVYFIPPCIDCTVSFSVCI